MVISPIGTAASLLTKHCRRQLGTTVLGMPIISALCSHRHSTTIPEMTWTRIYELPDYERPNDIIPEQTKRNSIIESPEFCRITALQCFGPMQSSPFSDDSGQFSAVLPHI